MVSPFPVSALRAEKEGSHMPETMLNLTLEIIYLLTGENYVAFKLCDGLIAPNLNKTQNPFTDQPPSLTPEKNDKKIEEVTQKIIELLTAEIPSGHQDDTEVHKHLYKDIEPENWPSLTSADGSKNTPERGPRSLNSRDLKQEHQALSAEDQKKSVLIIKIKDEENPYMMDDDQCKEEEMPPEIRIDGLYRQHSEDKCSADSEDDDEFPTDSVDDPIIAELHLSPYSSDLFDFSTHGENVSDPSPYEQSEKFLCSQCGKSFTQIEALRTHKKTHTKEAPHSSPKGRQHFVFKTDFSNHLTSQNSDQPYTCSYCKKQFLSKSRLDRHEIIHTGHKPYSCSICDKCFTQKANLARHERTHTGEKPFACPDCGKCFTRKATLVEHQYLHTAKLTA